MSVLPARDRGGARSVAGPVVVLDELPLSPAARVVVVADRDDQLYVVPATGRVGAAEVHRAEPGAGVAEAVLDVLRAGSGRSGSFEVVAWHSEDGAGETAVTVDQTNESVVVGGVAVVKWVVRPSREPHPAPHRLAVLAAAGFAGMPRPWGLLLWHDPRRAGSAPVLLATAAAYVPGATDGWEWAVEHVRQVTVGQQGGGASLAPAVATGELTAALHLALATDGVRAAPESLARTWHDRAVQDLDRALELVGGDEGARLSALSVRVRDAFAGLAGLGGTPLIAVHGDLHVGQVLRHGDPARYLVTDFDGSPVLGPGQRLDRAPAALDVAGMLQSLDHVGRVVVRRTPGVDAGRVRSWVRDAQHAFLATYRAGLAADGRSELLDERALAANRVWQECREHLYAVEHLPHWRYVPDAALPDLLDELALEARQ